jgi:hypothetical protein
LRIAQKDILDFGQKPEYESPEFPEGYWPKSEAPPSDAAWRESVRAFRSDLRAIEKMVADAEVDFTAPIPHLDGVSWLREILLVVGHNSYHVGQIVQLRRALGCWEG